VRHRSHEVAEHCRQLATLGLVSPNWLDVLRRFRPFRDGTPSHDHLGDVFATLDAEKFQRCFVAWAAALTGAAADVMAIDDKTPRRSYQKKGAKPRSI
jgi:hypothetical protein